MKLTVLGSGNAVPTKHRSSSAYLLEATDLHFLIDCGSGTLRRLLEHEYHLGGINHILLTHTHPDHVSDLVPLLHAKFVWELFAKAMKAESPMNEYPIDLIGPRGFETVVRTIANVTDPSMLAGERVSTFQVQFTEVTNTALKRGAVSIQTVQTEAGEQNYPPSVAYLITDQGKRILFTGDVRRTEEIVALATAGRVGDQIPGVDVLVIDCTGGTDMPPGGHLNPPYVAQAALDMGAKKVILTHLSEFILHDEDLVQSVKSAFRGAVILARDGLKLEL